MDVREYYQSDGEWKPGKKGINLLPDQWDILCEAAPDINKQLKAPPPPAAAAAPAAKAGARQPAAAAAAAAAGPTGGGGGGEVQLGGKKRAEAREFKGQWYVDLRWVQKWGRHVLAGRVESVEGLEWWVKCCRQCVAVWWGVLLALLVFMQCPRGLFCAASLCVACA